MRLRLRSVPLLFFGLLSLSLLPAGRAAACSSTYLVFFNPDSSIVSERGEQVLGAFVDHINGPPSFFEVFPAGCGNRVPPSDRSVILMAHAHDPETPDQCALSLARALAVRERLIALGIPASSIALEILGDTRKLVPAEDEEARRQNRRVQLTTAPASGLLRDSGGRWVRPQYWGCLTQRLRADSLAD
ncbi:OmpA family protein [Pseudoroseomonas cervicalis]|uniref:OmpA family protein n=1 Tax=Teichococcus cervicalis TaxID=204525 RepID=UPI0027823F7A|nr:OmpA family protein [Pseudoroseomonas cervicalis]MDQ1077525.1 outer membrane protein OmpA-like peptidoglycan-associated protein [Pseudoroseomonas cervicalis]